jgi:hypothetical protein
MVIHNELEGLGSNLVGVKFSVPIEIGLGPTQSHTVFRLKEEYSYTSISLLGLHDRLQGEIYFSLFSIWEHVLSANSAQRTQSKSPIPSQADVLDTKQHFL